MILLMQLFLAHIIGDFLLQPNSWVKHKERHVLRSKWLYVHVCIHFLLILIITSDFQLWHVDELMWKQALLITLLHWVIDLGKLYFQQKGDKRRWFFIDQLLHIIVLVAVWACTTDLRVNWHILSQQEILVPVTAWLFLLKPSSVIIRYFISTWTPTHTRRVIPAQQPVNSLQNQRTRAESLENAGAIIGVLERSLVLVFILLNHWEGVGFLLAAKSVFRFGDLKESDEMKLTEYVLIGTLLSFGIATITGILAYQILQG